jgi:ribonuclease J
MRVRIHRGASEIGGNCIELEAGGARLVLDVGRPISAPLDADVPLPEVSGLARGDDPSLAGIVLSHPHLDHYGLLAKATPSVPLYVGAAAHRILCEAAFFTGGAPLPEPAGHLRHRAPFDVPPFRITPFLNDHSAFDAYSLLVEADGRRLFYTGDIRGHGRKAGIFEELLRLPPAGVDVLLMEGTQVRRDSDGSERGISERQLEDACVETFRATSGAVLAFYSPQNVDRLVTLYRAAIRSGRDFVMDLYAATIAAATGLSTIPQAEWERVRVYLPKAQRSRVIREGAFARTDAVRPRRIFPEELAARPGELVLSCREGMLRELEAAGCVDGAQAVWSMWPGYLKQPTGERLLAPLARLGIPLTIHHASGHAFVPDLQRLVAALAPARVVPIHSEATERFAEFFPRVEPHSDGDWWVV